MASSRGQTAVSTAALMERVYDAAGNLERWESVMQELRNLFGLPEGWMPVSANGARDPGDVAAPVPKRRRGSFLALLPHLARAAAIHVRLAGETQLVQDQEQFLKQLAVGVILVDDKEAPAFINPAAEKFLRQFNGTASLPGKIALGTGRETQQLRSLIHEAVMAGLGPDGAGHGVLHTGSDDPEEQLRIVVIPLRGEESPFARIDGRICAMIVLAPAWYPELPPDQLMRLEFGFTRAEALLASRLLEGATLQEIASGLSLSKETLRVQLKSIFRKTGTHRQAELISLLARQPAAWVRSHDASPASCVEVSR